MSAPAPWFRHYVSLPLALVLTGGLVLVASIGNSPAQDPQRGQDQPPAGSARDQRIGAIEKTLETLLKEVQALRQPDRDTGGQSQSAPAPAAGGRGGGRRGSGPPPSFEVSTDSIKSLNWRSIGPANMGGRVTSIAVAKNDPSLWWIATAAAACSRPTTTA